MTDGPGSGGSVRPVPAGSCLLHVGPPKTGTTSIQAAFHANRDGLLAQGVRYAGRTAHPRRIAYAALRRPERGHLHRPPPQRLWLTFAAGVRAATEPRVVVSSEIFTDGDEASDARVVRDLGGDRVHVVITLRPLRRILASQWQQGLKGGLAVGFERWIRLVLDGEGPVAQRFWKRHRHDRLVTRWATLVGRDHVSVIAVDEADHSAVLRGFEGLLALAPGTLPVVEGRANRSMTLREATVLRTLNRRVRTARIRSSLGLRIRNAAAARYLQCSRERPGEARLIPPAWAVARVDELDREMLARILASGVQVVGDARRLAAGTGPAGDGGRRPVSQISRTATMALGAGIPALRLVDAIALGLGRAARPDR